MTQDIACGNNYLNKTDADFFKFNLPVSCTMTLKLLQVNFQVQVLVHQHRASYGGLPGWPCWHSWSLALRAWTSDVRKLELCCSLPSAPPDSMPQILASEEMMSLCDGQACWVRDDSESESEPESKCQWVVKEPAGKHLLACTMHSLVRWLTCQCISGSTSRYITVRTASGTWCKISKLAYEYIQWKINQLLSWFRAVQASTWE